MLRAIVWRQYQEAVPSTYYSSLNSAFEAEITPRMTIFGTFYSAILNCSCICPYYLLQTSSHHTSRVLFEFNFLILSGCCSTSQSPLFVLSSGMHHLVLSGQGLSSLRPPGRQALLHRPGTDYMASHVSFMCVCRHVVM
jgi:hypothetical protein